MKSTAMKKSIFITAVLTLFLLISASITWAQVTKTLNGTVRYESGMSETKFSTPNGDIVLKLPQSLSGASITGTVSTEPAGKTEKEKNRNLKELLKLVVMLDGQKIPMSATPTTFDWLTHLDRNQRTPIELLNVSSVKILDLSLPPVLPTPARMVLQPDRTPLLTTPSNVLVKGDALNVYTDQQFSPGEKFILKDSRGQQFTVKPICLSSNQAVINVPATAVPGELTVTEEVWNQPISGYNLSSVKINLIDISLSSPNTNLRPGQGSYVLATISGLLWEDHFAYSVDLRNLNPNTVTMEGGNLQRVYTANQSTGKKSGTETISDSFSFQLRRNITGNAAGSFSVSATLHEDYNTSNDPFRPQINVLKTPEDFNAWANALKKDLKEYEAVQKNDPSYDDPLQKDMVVATVKTNTQRAIDNMPVCTSPEQVDECKAVAYSLITPMNVPKEVTTMWLSGVEAYKAASNAIPSIISGNPQLIDWEVIKKGLAYINRLGKQLQDYNLENGTVEADKMIKQIQTQGETKETLNILNGTLEQLNMQLNNLQAGMPEVMKALLPGGILFSTKFTPPGTTDLPVEVTEIWWTSYPTDIYLNCIAIALHFTGDITLKQLSVRVNWVSKDGKKAGAADYTPKIEDLINYHYCDTLRKYPSWPEDFTAATIVNTLPKDEIDLAKVKVTVSVNGKKVGEGKPGEGRPGK